MNTLMGIVFALLGASAIIRLVIDISELKERLNKKNQKGNKGEEVMPPLAPS